MVLKRWTAAQNVRAGALLSVCAVFIFCPILAMAQHHADPLSEKQIDQIRELGDRPNERIKLYLQFLEGKLDAIQQLSTDAGENNRPEQLRSSFEMFSSLLDEMGDNIDTYHRDHADIRKALKLVGDSSAKWQDTLRKPPANPAYEIAQRGAMEDARDLAAEVVQLLADEQAYFAVHKDEANKNGRAPTPE